MCHPQTCHLSLTVLPFTVKRKQKAQGTLEVLLFFFFLGVLPTVSKTAFPLCSFVFLLLPWDSPFSEDTMTEKNARKGLVFKIQSRP